MTLVPRSSPKWCHLVHNAQFSIDEDEDEIFQSGQQRYIDQEFLQEERIRMACRREVKRKLPRQSLWFLGLGLKSNSGSDRRYRHCHHNKIYNAMPDTSLAGIFGLEHFASCTFRGKESFSFAYGGFYDCRFESSAKFVNIESMVRSLNFLCRAASFKKPAFLENKRPLDVDVDRVDRIDFEKCIFLADVDFTLIDESNVSFIDCWKIASTKYQEDMVNFFEDLPPTVAMAIACFCGERVVYTLDLMQQEDDLHLSKWTIE